MKKIIYSVLAISGCLLSAGMLFGCGAGNNIKDPAESEKKEAIANVDGFILHLSEDEKYYSVAGYDGYEENLSVPSEYSELPVLKIGESAFENNTEILSVILPNTLKTIGKQSFSGCTNLSSITIPYGVEDMEHGAFANCTGLTTITLPESLRSISSNVFYGCTSLASVTIPNSVTSIGGMAFANCNSITSLSLGNGVELLGGGAFSDCTRLTSLTIPQNITCIEFNAFKDCTALNSLTISASQIKIEISDSSFEGCHNIVTATIPAYAAKYIPKTSLESVVITDGEEIESNAFLYSYNLHSVELPESIVRIGGSAFKNCFSLTEIDLPNNLQSIAGGAFNGCTSLTSIIIPEKVTLIGSETFMDCTALKKIQWNAKSVDDFSMIAFTFENAGTASEGIELIFGDDVERIPAYMFRHNDKEANLISVNTGNGLTSIGDQAFANCQNLKQVLIGNNVKDIGYRAFYNCNNLAEIIFNAVSVNDIPNNSFPFYNAGKDGDGIEVTFGDDVLKIPARLFNVGGINAPKICRITISENVKIIGNSAFCGCIYLTTIEFGGTKTQWLEIVKDTDWNSNTGYYTIRCTDGNLSKI